jgi:hypothetical protein
VVTEANMRPRRYLRRTASVELVLATHGGAARRAAPERVDS